MLNPSAASWRTNSAPMPDEAPVTRAQGPYCLAKLDGVFIGFLPYTVRSGRTLPNRIANSGLAGVRMKVCEFPRDWTEGPRGEHQCADHDRENDLWKGILHSRARIAGEDRVEQHAGVGPFLEP